MTKQKLLSALEEMCSAYRDAIRRYQAGDERAIESNALQATYKEAEDTVRISKQDIAMGEF